MTTLAQFRPRRPTSVERAVYTVKEVAQLLDLSLGGTYTLVREGTIPALKIGGRWVIPKKRFHAWLDGFEHDQDGGLESSPDGSTASVHYLDDYTGRGGR